MAETATPDATAGTLPATRTIFIKLIDEHVNLTHLAGTGSVLCDDSSTFSQFEYVVGIVMLTIIIAGIFANCLNIAVFGSRYMRRSSLINWYLAGLSVSDLLALVCSMFNFPLPRIAEHNRFLKLSTLATQALYIAFPVCIMAQTSSVWLTVCVSWHRFVCVQFPFSAHRFCNRRMVKTVIGAVVAYSIIYNLPKCFELAINSCYSSFYDGMLAVAHPGKLRTDTYVQIYLGWMYMLVMLAIPFILLISMNSLVVLSVHRSRMKKTHLDNACAESRAEARKELKTTLMLIGVVVVFLVCNTLALFSSFLEIDIIPKPSKEVYTLIVDLSNTLVLINMSINIVIYLAFSDKYRTLAYYYISYCFDRQKAHQRLIDQLEIGMVNN